MGHERWSSNRSLLENNQILISICDTGIGFPTELAEEIFNPFFTTKVNGTGMGLRISRSIIEAHGGRMWAVSSRRARRNVPSHPARWVAGRNTIVALHPS